MMSDQFLQVDWMLIICCDEVPPALTVHIPDAAITAGVSSGPMVRRTSKSNLPKAQAPLESMRKSGSNNSLTAGGSNSNLVAFAAAMEGGKVPLALHLHLPPIFKCKIALCAYQKITALCTSRICTFGS